MMLSLLTVSPLLLITRQSTNPLDADISIGGSPAGESANRDATHVHESIPVQVPENAYPVGHVIELPLESTHGSTLFPMLTLFGSGQAGRLSPRLRNGNIPPNL
jgi:hypothetical protein